MTLSQLANEALGGRWKSLKHPEDHYYRAHKLDRLVPGLEPGDFPTRQEEVEARLRGEGLSDSTIRKYMQILSTLGFPIVWKPVPSPERRVLSTEELHTLDDRIREIPNDRVRGFYAMLRDSGCRGLTELGRLKLEEIDWDRKTFVLDSYKGRYRRRTIPMTDVTETALSWYAHNGVLLPTPATWRKYWVKVRLDKSNRPYDLRHTFCTRLLSNGVPPPTVQRIMGHATLDQTMVYFHQTTEALDNARRALSLT